MDEGTHLPFGGQPASPEGLDGYFFSPTLFTGVTTDMQVAQDEIFGPVLPVFEVSSYAEAVAVANDTQFGLSSALYTSNVEISHRAMRDLEAGITYINGPTIGAEAHMPFGGVKDTGNGHRDGGWGPPTSSSPNTRRSTSTTPDSSRRRRWTLSPSRQIESGR